jgi:putative transcriptional regulator
MDKSTLKAGLLLAMPQSSDPNLSGTVLLLIEHGGRRSLSLMINRPSDIRASELLASLGTPWRGKESDVVWSGGPVSPHQGWVLHDAAAATPQAAGTFSITPTISVSTTPERLRVLASEPPGRIRILLGSLDWAVGQLAEAVSRGGACTDATPELVFDTAHELLWERVQSIGEKRLVADGGLGGAIRRIFGQRRAVPTAIARRK